jgi:ABC-type multidrug transport system fused ATPase/permease subunit
MGNVYDTIKAEKNPRCSDVKGAIVIINLSGASISFILLFVSILLMSLKKGRLSFLTKIIIFIFSSEILNTISKLLQMLKYAFDDTRDKDDKNEVETSRGIICQIQIVTSIISDFCSLLGTLLLSYRCYEVMKGKKRIFDQKKSKVIVIVLIILISVILSIVFLFIDREITKDSITYKYDLRDRCSYWCWLDHTTSIICYCFFFVALLFNVIYAVKTNCYLRNSYKQILEQSLVFAENTENNDNIQISKNNNYSILASDDKKRLKEIRIMQIKCFIYPLITIIIWFFLTLYRFIDDIEMKHIDDLNDRNKGENDEMTYFNDRPGLREFVEFNLVFHTILSSFRGILYGICFIIFEEKVFKNIFRNCCFKYCKCCFGAGFFEEIDEGQKDPNKESLTSDALLMTESMGRSSNEDDANIRKTTTDLNTSDYNYNE